MDYVQMTLDDWMSLKKEIKEEFIKASTSFVRIGYLLRKAEDSEGYKNDGYDSLTEWAHDELGLTATYVSRFKAINAKYSEGGYSDHLLPEFIGYGSAKLGEMLALPDEDMEMLTPEMKRSDIRALKEFNRDEPEAPDTESWILEMMEIIPEGVKEDLAKEYLQGALDGRKCAEIINPSGNSMKRTRAAMVAMTDEGLFVKTFGPEGGRRKISWQDFAQMLCERYEKWKPQESAAKPEENTRPATENAQHATESDQSDLLSDATEKLGRSIGYAYDKASLYGIGTKMPLGVVTRLAQTTKPADYPAEARPWADLHSTNIITVTQADSVGIKLFQELATAFGKTKNAFSRGGKWWAMNDTTYNKLLVQAMNINGAGNVYSAISPDGGSTMPVIGGKIESLEFIPDDVILAGYDKLYTMGERKGVTIKQSEHVFFTDDAIAVKGTARYDGKPVIPEAFVAIGINGVTPSDAMTFLPDVANTVTGIILSNATATVKATKTVQLTAKTLPVDAAVTWTSSDTTKATVSSDGVVTGVAAGSATITATCGTCTAVCAVTVTN